MFKWFKRTKKEPVAPIKMKPVAGVFSEYENVLAMPIERYNALQIAEKGLVWNITHKELLDALKQISKSLAENQIDSAKIIAYAVTEKVELNSLTNPEPILEIISILYIHKDENPKDYSAEWTLKKKELFRKDDELRRFFFLSFFKTYKKLEEQYQIDFLNYLEQAETVYSQLTKLVTQYTTQSSKP